MRPPKRGLGNTKASPQFLLYKAQIQVQNDQSVIELPAKSSRLFDVLLTISTSQSKVTKHTKKQKYKPQPENDQAKREGGHPPLPHAII